jgi:hypothetical protein
MAVMRAFMARLQRVAAGLVGLALTLCAGALVAAADQLSAEQIAFFEQKVRPLFVEHCYECHSSQSNQIKGGLPPAAKAEASRSSGCGTCDRLATPAK